MDAESLGGRRPALALSGEVSLRFGFRCTSNLRSDLVMHLGGHERLSSQREMNMLSRVSGAVFPIGIGQSRLS